MNSQEMSLLARKRLEGLLLLFSTSIENDFLNNVFGPLLHTTSKAPKFIATLRALVKHDSDFSFFTNPHHTYNKVSKLPNIGYIGDYHYYTRTDFQYETEFEIDAEKLYDEWLTFLLEQNDWIISDIHVNRIQKRTGAYVSNDAATFIYGTCVSRHSDHHDVLYFTLEHGQLTLDETIDFYPLKEHEPLSIKGQKRLGPFFVISINLEIYQK